ncbi:MAG: hypothetical protein KDA74_03375 [Planctomycetaceae bacterium]|nr:hypothetical protein [Planctomycetaceae bacterium]
MLTRQNILLITAALQFWAEEMDPNESQLLKVYSGDPTADQIWTADEIQQLRSQLSSARLKYAMINPAGTEFLTSDLFSTQQAAEQTRIDTTSLLATVILPAPLESL